MNYKIKINVTKDVLFKSRFCKIGGSFNKEETAGANCAIAIAIREIFPNAFVSCYGIDPYFYENYTGKQIPQDLINLPVRASDFIKQFDNKTPEERVKMEPISFEINVPEDIINKIGISEAKEILQNSPTMELIKA